MTDKEILQRVKEQLKADIEKYLQPESKYYDVGFYANQILLAITLMENKKR